MSVDKLLELKIKSFLQLSVANHEYDTQIQEQIDIMKKHISFFDIKKGYFKCYVPYGVGLAEKKEALSLIKYSRAIEIRFFLKTYLCGLFGVGLGSDWICRQSRITN